MAEARRRRLSPARRHFLLQVLGVIAVIGVLVWGADTLARIGAQSLLARNIQDATGVEVLPEVDAHGIFFLPQVIRGAYSDVHVTTSGHNERPAAHQSCRVPAVRRPSAVPRCVGPGYPPSRPRTVGGKFRSDI